MPKVPQYQQQVQTNAMPNVQVTRNAPIEAFGGGGERVQRAAMSLQDTTQKFIAKERQKANDMALTEADAQFSQFINDSVHGPEGFLTRKGKDSFSSIDDAQQAIKAKADEMSKAMANDDQRAAFRELFLKRSVDVDRQLQKHVSVEMMHYDNDITDSAIKAEQSAALANYMDPIKVQDSLQTQAHHILRHAERQGKPQEWIDQKLSEINSQTHGGIIERMIDSDQDMAAMSYYQSNKDKISGDMQARLEKVLEAGSLRGESQRAVDAVMSKGMTMTAALKQVREQYKDNPKLRDEVVRRTKERYSDDRAAKQADQDALYQDSYNDLIQAKSLTAIPPTKMASLTPSQQENLRKIADGMRDGFKTDWTEYTKLRKMAAHPDTRAAFAKLNPLDFRSVLDDAKYKEILDLQDGIIKGDPKAHSLADGIETDMQITTRSMELAGITLGKKASKEQKLEAESYHRRLEQLKIEKQQELGRSLNSTEIRELNQKLRTEVVLERRSLWYDKVKPAYQLSIDDVPKQDRQAIEMDLKMQGIPVTEQSILEVFIQENTNE